MVPFVFVPNKRRYAARVTVFPYARGASVDVSQPRREASLVQFVYAGLVLFLRIALVFAGPLVVRYLDGSGWIFRAECPVGYP